MGCEPYKSTWLFTLISRILGILDLKFVGIVFFSTVTFFVQEQTLPIFVSVFFVLNIFDCCSLLFIFIVHMRVHVNVLPNLCIKLQYVLHNKSLKPLYSMPLLCHFTKKINYNMVLIGL